jgi:hypothetical protein
VHDADARGHDNDPVAAVDAERLLRAGL